MGWVKTVPKPHDCDLPTDAVSITWMGSEWQCDECNVLWRVEDIDYIGYSPRYAWERVN